RGQEEAAQLQKRHDDLMAVFKAHLERGVAVEVVRQLEKLATGVLATREQLEKLVPRAQLAELEARLTKLEEEDAARTGVVPLRRHAAGGNGHAVSKQERALYTPPDGFVDIDPAPDKQSR